MAPREEEMNPEKVWRGESDLGTAQGRSGRERGGITGQLEVCWQAGIGCRRKSQAESAADSEEDSGGRTEETTQSVTVIASPSALSSCLSLPFRYCTTLLIGCLQNTAHVPKETIVFQLLQSILCIEPNAMFQYIHWGKVWFCIMRPINYTLCLFFTLANPFFRL